MVKPATLSAMAKTFAGLLQQVALLRPEENALVTPRPRRDERMDFSRTISAYAHLAALAA
jgi:hypothetical protein